MHEQNKKGLGFERLNLLTKARLLRPMAFKAQVFAFENSLFCGSLFFIPEVGRFVHGVMLASAQVWVFEGDLCELTLKFEL